MRGSITKPHTRHTQSLAPLQQILSRHLGGASFGPFSNRWRLDKPSMIPNDPEAILIRQTAGTIRPATPDVQNQCSKHLHLQQYHAQYSVAKTLPRSSIIHAFAHYFFCPQRPENSCYLCSDATLPRISLSQLIFTPTSAITISLRQCMQAVQGQSHRVLA